MYEVNDSRMSSLCSPHGSVPTCSSQTVFQGNNFLFYVLDTGKLKTFCNFYCLAFTDVAGCPAPAMLLMQKLLAMPPKLLWQIAHTFISHFRSILDDAVPRQVQGMFFYNLKIIEEI